MLPEDATNGDDGRFGLVFVWVSFHLSGIGRTCVCRVDFADCLTVSGVIPKAATIIWSAVTFNMHACMHYGGCLRFALFNKHGTTTYLLLGYC